MAKKICMVAYTHYHQDARPRRAAEALVARGDQVDFLALKQDGLPEQESVGGVELFNLPTRKYRGGGKANYIKSYLDFFFRCLVWITRRQISRRYDVIYLHTMPDFIVFASAVARLFGAKVVLDVHDTMPELFSSKFGLAKSHLLIRFLELQERLSCRFADHVVCVHEPHRALLEKRGAVQNAGVSVLMNLPDPSVFGREQKPVSGEGSAGPRLVYHGTVARRLGLDLALRAFALVREVYPDARFDIYGAGDAVDDVRAVMAELSLHDCVGFEGTAFRLNEVPGFLAGASLGVVPNRRDPATEMMLPVKLLEYLYLGIPVVAPRLEAIEYYFSSGSVSYYEPEDIQSCADAMLSVLGDGALREEQAAQAQSFYERFSWGHMKQRLYEVVDAA